MRRQTIILVLIVFVLGSFWPVFDTQAFLGLPSLGDISYKAATSVFAYSAFIMFSAIGTFMGILVEMLDWAVNLRIYTSVPVIQEGWKIMRDFANMLFIIALIVMAYGTIFNIPKYDFRSLIPRFIVIAVLINFSLVLGGLMIDATQVLNNTFLAAMGDISGQLGQGMEPWKLLPDAAQASDRGEAFASLILSSFVTLIFAIFLAFAFLVSVAVPLTVAFVRIPVLWALLIVSPMAWLLSILPATRGAYNAWWKQFLAWNLFLPYYLFFLYFALYFLSKKKEVLAGLGQTFVNDKVTGLTGLQSDFTFGLIFYYVLIAIFLIGGTKVAMSAGQFSGTGIVNVAKWGRGVAMRRLGVTAAQRATMQRLEQVQKEGLPGRFGQILYGGERALELETARRARLFGVKGALEKGIEIEKEKQKPFANNISELRRLAESGSSEQKLAARMRLTELGALDRSRVNETYRMLGGDRSEAASKYIGGIDFTKFSTEDRRAFAGSLTNIEARKKNAMAMLEKDRIETENLVELVQGLAIRDEGGRVLNTGDINEILEKGKKKNLLSAAIVKSRLGLAGAGTDEQEIRKAFDKITDTQILELERDTFEDPVARAELNRIFRTNPKRLENITRQATGELRAGLDRMLQRTRLIQAQREAERVNADVDTLRAERQAVEAQAEAAGTELANLESEMRDTERRVDEEARNPAERAQLQRQVRQTERRMRTRERESQSFQNELKQIDKRIKDIASKPGRPGETLPGEEGGTTYSPGELREE